MECSGVVSMDAPQSGAARDQASQSPSHPYGEIPQQRPGIHVDVVREHKLLISLGTVLPVAGVCLVGRER